MQVEHPWQFRYAQRLRSEGKPLILSTHNCETKLVSQEMKEHLPGRGNYAIDQVAAIESHALKHADHVITVSEEDIADFDNVLGVNIKEKATVVPNGVDCRMTNPPTPHERNEARAAIGAGEETIALFLGT
ncbi:MAG: glycosyltransferase family 4 protein, partial [Candidatus Thermoplasmatota archaeon]|nr:glycosyltransferase family 4 protein [Candidatus Thermoplasmatota archaeon]